MHACALDCLVRLLHSQRQQGEPARSSLHPGVQALVLNVNASMRRAVLLALCAQAGSLGSFARASVGSLPTWRSQQQPLLRKVKTSAAAATGNSFPGPGGLRACAGRGSSGLGVQQQQDQDQDLGGDADAFGDVQALPACEPRWPFDQAAAGGLAAAQREHLLQLSGQRSRDSGCLDGSATTDGSSGVSGVVTPDQQAREARAAQAQRLAAQLRQARPFLHLDRCARRWAASQLNACIVRPAAGADVCNAVCVQGRRCAGSQQRRRARSCPSGRRCAVCSDPLPAEQG